MASIVAMANQTAASVPGAFSKAQSPPICRSFCRGGRYNTLAELLAAAKAKPGELNYSTVGIGSAAHFGAVRLAVSAGITAQQIPLKGPEWLADAAITDVANAPPIISA